MSSGNLFQDVLEDARAVEERLLGPNYPYYKHIKTPSQIGMSDKGTIKQMSKNIEGLIEYVQLLVSGDSKASATGRPLGNKFFLQTGGKCLATDQCADANDPTTCEKVDRYIYVNNVPQGNIPFITSGMGVTFTDLRGLIPGAMGNLEVLNPFGIMRAFLSGATPPCQPITMETINNDNVKSSETNYVTLVDIRNMNPCTFPERKNPITGVPCREAFHTRSPLTPSSVSASNELLLPDDPLAQAYFAGLGALGIYIFYRLMEKTTY